MNDYNETCFLTGLPIRKGDKIKALFLASAPHPGEWKPATMAVTGTYDGRRGISNIIPDAGMLKVLRGIPFKTAGDGDTAGTLIGTHAIDGNNYQDMICQMSVRAAEGELSILVHDAGDRNPKWHPAEIVMAHDWAWMHLVTSNRHYEGDVKGNKALERAVSNTIRETVRHSCDGPAETSDMSVRLRVLELASLMAGMGALGIAFHPMLHEARYQDGLDWKTGFYRQAFLHAVTDPYQDASSRLAKLDAQIDWILNGG